MIYTYIIIYKAKIRGKEKHFDYFVLIRLKQYRYRIIN